MPAKHALLIGVDHYCNLAAKFQLGGCVNDAKLMKDVLTTYFGFSDNEITELHNEGATQAAILAAMNALVDEAAKDDIVVFHFSGHGSQRTSKEQTEGTGKDSTIMPHDSGRNPKPNLDISDKEINEWLLRLTAKTKNVSLTFDCCHSGTITREAFEDMARSVPDDDRSLAEMGIDPDSLPTIERPATRGKDDSRWYGLADRYVSMSGCRDDELSREFSREEGGKKARNGALTYFLTNALVRAKPGTTYRDVFELAHQGVNTRYPMQNPQIEGAMDRELFGTQEIEPLRFVPIAEVHGDTVTLKGGAAHGVVAGSLWTVLPPGTKKKDGARPLGLIEITSVDALTAEAAVKDQTADFEIGARCVEKAPSPSQFQLKVDLGQLDGRHADELRAAIAESALVVEAESEGAADMRAYVLEPRSGSADPVPSVTSVAEHSWALVNREGALAMPLRPVAENDAIAILVENLETQSRYNNALSLDNPDDNLDVKFNIYRSTGKDQWEEANGGKHVFEEGDQIAIELINNESRSVFFSVLDFGLSGKIALLYPRKTSSEPVAAGKPVVFGKGKARIHLGLPQNFPADREQGTGAFKAFITTNEADFEWLRQEGMRSADSAKTALEQQFKAAYDGPTTREGNIVGEDEEDESWIAVTRSFDIRRKET